MLSVDAAGKETYALKAELLGIVAAAYSLGAILSVPFVPIVAQKFGRRWSIMLGSMIMVLGSILQGFAVNGEQVQEVPKKFHLMMSQRQCTSLQECYSDLALYSRLSPARP